MRRLVAVLPFPTELKLGFGLVQRPWPLQECAEACLRLYTERRAHSSRSAPRDLALVDACYSKYHSILRAKSSTCSPQLVVEEGVIGQRGRKCLRQTFLEVVSRLWMGRNHNLGEDVLFNAKLVNDLLKCRFGPVYGSACQALPVGRGLGSA
ncbi:uncharacterized protein SCHCODRAFT_02371101 [Schizophyllum commune H4-8]|uniref:uncharacterized protein n=1 Tax=Schizophyllum commune (strain H4-8 / FGSC 9210) TaxID=578458 RepID=UPI0021603D1E|nr:uncharacterized protein SCHCODRAFT_02371101 [Schizophyllum commune H4-8]KAI5889580.1 hypothetical protein SCHCODRAFT_02371101 [Schizophyllum commune H4-8]